MTLIASIQTPAGRAGAIGVVQIVAGDSSELDDWLDSHALACPVGSLVLRDLLGADTGIVARWIDRSVHLMPHGGVAVGRKLLATLAESGVTVQRALDPIAAFPEARSPDEARVLAALARAASPLAVDLLLDQHHRVGEPDAEHSRVLNRLITPPLVVAVGPSNVGKSTLLNALAGRRVSVVADEPGTTRDHVGIQIDLAGLVVRFVDTPGVRADAGQDERAAARLAAEVIARADLVLCCANAGHAEPERPIQPSLVVGLRADLGKPEWAHDAAVSAQSGEGLEGLVGLIRDTLVPPAVLGDPRAWRPSWSSDSGPT